MKLRTRIFAAVLSVLMFAAFVPMLTMTAFADGEDLTAFSAMTYNIKNTTINSTQISVINNASPSILGAQEVISSSYSSMSNSLSGYTGIQGGGAARTLFSEYAPIFYKTSMFTKVQSGTFWLSPTPDTPNTKFSDAEYERVCTWALLRVNGTSNPTEYVLVLNTHLDYGPVVDGKWTYNATGEGIDVIVQKIQYLQNQALSSWGVSTADVLGTVLTGDFNIGRDYIYSKYLTGVSNASINGTPKANTYTGTTLKFAYDIAATKVPNTAYENSQPYASVYNNNAGGYVSYLDHIVVTHRTIGVDEYRVVPGYDSGDHLPVMTRLHLKQPVYSTQLSVLNVDATDASFSFYKDGSSTPAGYTSLNCAPTSLGVQAMIKFFNDSTQSGTLEAYVDALEIYNGPQDAVSYTPTNLDLSTPSVAPITTYTESNTPVVYTGYNGNGTSSTNKAVTWGNGTLSGATEVQTGPHAIGADYTEEPGSVRLSNPYTLTATGSSVGNHNASYNMAATNQQLWGATGSTGGSTFDIILKFNSLPVYSSISATTSSATNPVGQTGFIVDIWMRRYLSYNCYNATRASSAKASQDLYVCWFIYNDTVYISNLSGNRNKINESPIQYINTGISVDDMDSYHRYTIQHKIATTASTQQLKFFVDGVQVGTAPSMMYRGNAVANEGCNMTLSNRTNTSGYTDVTLDSWALYNSVLTPPDTSTFATRYTALSDAVANPSHYTADSVSAAQAALDYIKTDTSGIVNLNNAGYPATFNSSRATARTNDLADAYNALERISTTVDFSALTAAVAAANVLKAPMYSADSWAVLADLLAEVDYAETDQSAVDDLADAILGAIDDLEPNDMIWYEDFSGSSLPSTLGLVTSYPHGTVSHSYINGYWGTTIAHPSSDYNGDSKGILGPSVFGNADGVTINLYAAFNSLPTRSTSATQPFRGLSLDLYVGGVDKMLTVSLIGMTSTEKSANPGCDAWVCLFNVKRSGAVVEMPVNLGIGDGKVHKYTFVYDTSKVVDLSGNSFGVYSDSACTNLVSTINYAGPSSTSAAVPVYNTATDTGSGFRTYYVKQLETKEGWFKNNTVLSYTVKSADIDKVADVTNGTAITTVQGYEGSYEAYVGSYDGAAHPALISDGFATTANGSAAYTFGGNTVSSIPSISVPGTYDVVVTVSPTVYTSVLDPIVLEYAPSIDYMLSVALQGDALPGASVTASKSGSDLATYTSFATNYVPATRGDRITLTAAGSGFSYWKNVRTNKLISTASTLNYPVGSQMDLAAVYDANAVDPENTSSYTVIYRDAQTGKIFKTQSVLSGYALTSGDLPASTPAIYGYDFNGWKDASGADAVGLAIAADTTIYATYSRAAQPTYTLTVSDNGENTEYTLAFARTIALTASGTGFSYWEFNGELLSENETVYFGMPAGDATLTAVYNAAAPTAPTVVMMSGSVSADGGFAVTFGRNVPDGFTLVESGILMTRKATPADLYVGTTANVTKGVSTSAADVTCYGFQKDLNGKGGTWYFRGYMVYRDGSDNLLYAYSDTYQIVVTASTASTATEYLG